MIPIRVSCIVVAFHRPAELQKLLASLDEGNLDVIVVNVENDPAVAKVAAERNRPLDANVGYAAAVNHGVAHARGDVIVFTNDDVAANAADVESLARTVLLGRAEVCVPSVEDEDGVVERTISALPTPYTLARDWLLLPDRPIRLLRRLAVEKWRLPAQPERIDAAAAVMVAVRTSLLRRIPLPETYFLYWEESEWFWSLKRAGVTVMYEPSVRVRHSGGRNDIRPQKSILLARNAVRCIRRTQGRLQAMLAWPMVVLWNLRLVAVDALRSVVGSSVARRRLAARLVGLRAAVQAWREI